MDLKELDRVNPKTYWYYQSKKIPMLRYIRSVYKQLGKKLTLVDVGSGSGFFMYEAMNEIPEMIEKIWLVDIGYTEQEVAATKNQLIEKRRDLPDQIENGVVVMMDILEHLADDALMLRNVKARCRGKNYFFITVPAFQDLWSGHDIYLEHYRRYVIKTLTAVLKKENYTINKSYYIYFSIFPFVWIIRKLQGKPDKAINNLKSVNPIVNFVLRTYNKLEMHTGRWNKIFGVTCTAEGEI